MERVQLRLLGPVRVERGGVPIQGFESRKALMLLCYLALHDQPRTRSHLAELFWEGKTEERGRGNLSRVLHNLAQVVPGCIESTRATVALAAQSAIWIDVEAFDALLTQGDLAALAQAAELYRGDLLAESQLEDCPEFEQWLEGAREHWRQRQIQLLTRLISCSLQQGRASAGIPWAARLLQIDPWQEEAHRAMMQLLHADGRRSAALAQYETCRRVLAEELGVDPEAATVALYAHIRDTPALHKEVVVPREPSLAQLAARHWSIPSPTTSFVSRDAELALVLARVCDSNCRLLTIVGPGGVGKSRLVIQVMQQLEAAHDHETIFPHGSIFISLAAVEALTWHQSADPQAAGGRALATSIAAALQITFSGPDTPQKQVLNAISGKRLLLVLDNCEQFLAAGPFVSELLHAVPGMKILATSQVRLHLDGEHVVELGGLRFPAVPDLRDWRDYSAMVLFQHRAAAAMPSFEIAADNCDAIAHICQLVDGLPLGIELAASWVRLLACHEIAHEIGLNLRFLHSVQRDAPQRHRSLHAVFDYTWQSVSEEEQRVLRQLSVFRGGFTRDAATEVVGATLAVVAALIDRSLVQRTPAERSAAPTTRYTLLEVVRHYAAEKLAEASMQTEAETTHVHNHHQRYYLSFLAQRTHALRGSQQQATLIEIHQEIENIRSAWHRAMATSDWAHIDLALESLCHFYDMRSWFQEGETMFAQAAASLEAGQAHAPASRMVWGKLLARQGWFSFHIGRPHAAQALLEQSLTMLRSLGATIELVFPLHRLAAVLLYNGAYDAAFQTGQEALEISVMRNERYHIAISKTILAQIAAFQGHSLVAERLCQESLVIDRALGNAWGVAFSLMNLGHVACALENYPLAKSCFQEVLTIRKTLADIRGTAWCLNDLGDVALAQSQRDEAMAYYQSSLTLFRDICNQWGMADALLRLGYGAWDAKNQSLASGYFREALQTAIQTQTVPKILEALAGITLLLCAHQPTQAHGLATLIQQHPLSSKEAIDRANAILTQGIPMLNISTVSATRKQYAPDTVTDIAQALLNMNIG